MTQQEIDEVMKAHEKETQEALRKLDQNRDKQSESLRIRLADRRKQKQKLLRNKHDKQVRANID